MLKSKGTLTTIGVLLVILFALIFGFSNFSFNNNLNVNGSDKDNNNNPSPTPEFKYLPAIASTHENAIFENNFGGSEKEEIKNVYKLDYYYIIGNTTSQDKYFSKNKAAPTIFVLKLNENGSAMNIVCASQSMMYVTSVISGNYIYILAKQNENNEINSILLEYSFLTNNLNLLLTLKNETPLGLTKNDNIEILTQKNGFLNYHDYNVSTSANNFKQTNLSGELVLFAPYKNGAIGFINNNNKFAIHYFSTYNVEVVSEINNATFITFCNTSYGYLTLLKVNNNFEFYLLDFEFKILETISASQCNETTKLYVYNDLIYCITNTNQLMNVYLICSHGTFINNVQINTNISKYYFSKIINGTIYSVFGTIENNLSIIKLDKFGNVSNQLLLPSNNNNIPYDIVSTYDNNLMLLGNTINTDPLITRNFGKEDLYILKIKSFIA